MNFVTLVALFMPASSIFSWINFGVAGSAFASFALIYVTVPASTPRLHYDLEKEGAGREEVVSFRGDGIND